MKDTNTKKYEKKLSVFNNKASFYLILIISTLLSTKCLNFTMLSAVTNGTTQAHFASCKIAIFICQNIYVIFECSLTFLIATEKDKIS